MNYYLARKDAKKATHTQMKVLDQDEFYALKDLAAKKQQTQMAKKQKVQSRVYANEKG